MPSSKPTTRNVVLDANTLVSALLKDDSVPAAAVAFARTFDVICVSDAVVAELRAVLRRRKFRRYFSVMDAEDFLHDVLGKAARFVPQVPVSDCRDRKDNAYLELALAAEADIIVSGDRDLLDLHPWRGVRILTPAAYVADVEARLKTPS